MKVKLSLLLEVEYETNGTSVGELKEQLGSIAEQAVNNGMLTGETPATVGNYEWRVMEEPTNYHDKNLVLLIPEKAWGVMVETLEMDSQSGAFDKEIRNNIINALSRVKELTPELSSLLDEVELVPRAPSGQAPGGITIRFIGDERIINIRKFLNVFRSNFQMQGGKRIYKKKLI